MSREIMCQCGNCVSRVGGYGLSVTLRTKDRNEDQRAVFCSPYHAALSMLCLAQDRGQAIDWINIQSDLPRCWKSV
jgi:hypothetical protein